MLLYPKVNKKLTIEAHRIISNNCYSRLWQGLRQLRKESLPKAAEAKAELVVGNNISPIVAYAESYLKFFHGCIAGINSGSRCKSAIFYCLLPNIKEF